MSAFEQLHPALQHHVVNSLGWRELRPFQEAAIPHVLAGEHLLILAPTAGGKTEAAFLPVLSRMLSEDWEGLSLLYVCPIKALLNNLEVRLQRYCGLVGRRAALWHGDVKAAARQRILNDPPDCLLTTPESLEVMLVSRRVDRRRFFSSLRAVIVDEIHAFAGDDRGWHLLAVLERISRLAGREIQRIGLSATVGNPEALCDWLAGSCPGTRRVLLPDSSNAGSADVMVDFVSSLDNAATVISRLHRGEKRLVFVDSRSRAEQLAAGLRELQVSTFVTHSSLSAAERRQAEEAFATRTDCVIVATSVLELGIDVGDLDRVVQIDSPYTVSAFLQRMGRTGRRSGTERNCLFLATSEEALLRASAIVGLWASGFVEPVLPPALPLHVLAQQIMALTLQEGGLGRDAWRTWIGKMPGFEAMDQAEIDPVFEHMLATDILWEDEGILWFGRKGEERFGRRNFMALLSMITSEPLFTVRHGRDDLGFVHQTSFAIKQQGHPVLLLGGRSWRVNDLDWQHKVAYVEPAHEQGRSRWVGSGQPLSFEVCQAIRELLCSDGKQRHWSRRAAAEMEQLRDEMPWADRGSTAVAGTNEVTTWWTFAGSRANAALACGFQVRLPHVHVEHDNLSVSIEPPIPLEVFHAHLEEIRRHGPEALPVPISEEALEQLKFSSCLPPDLARRVLELRLRDAEAVDRVLREPVRFVG